MTTQTLSTSPISDNGAVCDDRNIQESVARALCHEYITDSYISMSDPLADPCSAASGLSASLGGLPPMVGVHRNREMSHQLMREAIIPSVVDDLHRKAVVLIFRHSGQGIHATPLTHCVDVQQVGDASRHCLVAEPRETAIFEGDPYTTRSGRFS